MLRLTVLLLALAGATLVRGADTAATTHSVPPKEVGSRTVVLDFTIDAKASAQTIDLVSTESLGLIPWAKALVKAGQVKTNSPGVVKLEGNRYRATISFPLPGDGAPLPANVTPPKVRLRTMPVYPFKLSQDSTPGGVLLQLTIDESGNMAKVEVVRASHKEFASAALASVKQWRFSEPAKRDGVPMAITLFQLVTFEVVGKPPATWEWQMAPEPALPDYLVSGNYLRIN